MTGLERMVCLTADLLAGQRVTSSYVREVYGVSRATAKRDCARLRRNLRTIKRLQTVGWQAESTRAA